MKTKPKFLSLLVCCLTTVLATTLPAIVAADDLVDYSPTGASNNTSSLAPSSVDTSLVTATNLTRGSGTAGYDNAGGNTDFFGAYYTKQDGEANGVDDATLGDAISNGFYLTFSITAGAKGALITGLNLDNDFYFQNAVTYTIEDSLTGFGTSSADQLYSLSYVNGARYEAGKSLTFATPEVLHAGQTDTFNIYVSGLYTYTDFGIGDGGGTPSNTNPFGVTGEVLPEPSTYALLAFGLGALALIARNRRSARA